MWELSQNDGPSAKCFVSVKMFNVYFYVYPMSILNAVDIENVFTFVLNLFFVFGFEMKVRTAFPQIWFDSANRVKSGTGRRLGSYRRFAKYSELISCLVVVEQNNELLLQNHQSRPTCSASMIRATVG